MHEAVQMSSVPREKALVTESRMGPAGIYGGHELLGFMWQAPCWVLSTERLRWPGERCDPVRAAVCVCFPTARGWGETDIYDRILGTSLFILDHRLIREKNQSRISWLK